MCPIIQSISSYSFALHFSSRKSALLKGPVVRLATEREKNAVAILGFRLW